MVILQHLPPNQTKFGEVLDCLLAKIINGISRVPLRVACLSQEILSKGCEWFDTSDVINLPVLDVIC